jgi:AAA15 family ATPase/GTPase
MIKVVMTALKEADPENRSEIPSEVSEFPSIPELRLVHAGTGGRSYALEESKESDGTRAYFSAIGPILEALESGSVLLIDEIETSLHPKLTRELVRIFNSPDLNQNGAQFIFTTHDTNLLDLGLLRRDQIWFTQKDKEGATELYPLSDFQPRTSQNIEAGYLGGRFGAIPFLDDQSLLDVIAQRSTPQSSLNFTGGE